MATTFPDVEGVKIGATGAALKAIRSGTVTIDPAAGTATVGDIVEASGTITGLAAGDLVILDPGATIAADVLWSVLSCTTDTVTIRLTQGTASQNMASTVFNYIWFDLT